jgi:hypothetical protein
MQQTTKTIIEYEELRKGILQSFPQPCGSKYRSGGFSSEQTILASVTTNYQPNFSLSRGIRK